MWDNLHPNDSGYEKMAAVWLDTLDNFLPVCEQVPPLIISAAAGAGGSISPSGAFPVRYESDQAFIITPNTDYHIEDVKVDGDSVGARTSYIFSDVHTSHTIQATFALDVLPQGIIIDNGDAGTSHTGTWETSGGLAPYGPDSLWARNGATYSWQMSSQPAGMYEVYMWWSGYSTRATNIAVAITHRDGVQIVNINQQQNAGQWNSLGQFYFNTTGKVGITAANGSTVSTCADAVRFVPVP
ncbi:MAG: hypothetical protein A2Y81_01070 [Nitrospirae bacterium RBG_13_43_8]|nr:MAG: hypothetical protein A2Y81_01070 [Nitrospirae bacterium RBG_13_43_8]